MQRKEPKHSLERGPTSEKEAPSRKKTLVSHNLSPSMLLMDSRVAVAMSAEDWETKYKEIWNQFMEEKKRTEVLKDRLISK